MKSMKSLSMNKMLGSIKRRTTGGPAPDVANIEASMAAVQAQSGSAPETTAHDTVKAFCEAGGHVKGDEVLFLPTIVDAAESSPTAAAECARLIRKYMRKEYYGRPAWQYNALMLLRILTQNPGPTFTRNLDQKFIDTAKDLLRGARDPSVRQMLMETLDEFEHTKSYDENLHPLIQMWKKEKEKVMKEYGGVPVPPPRPFIPASTPVQSQSQNYFSRSHRNNRLPDTVELASRLEEARTSAKLLEQVVMNTPTAETLDNELIKEFADRCLSASRSIQGYMVATDPGPDNDTMESLIDTNEQLQTALNQHQRSVLSARKQLGLNERSDHDNSGENTDSGSQRESNSLLETRGNEAAKGKQAQSYLAHASGSGSAGASGSGERSSSKTGKGKQTNEHEDPFADPFADPKSDESHGITSTELSDDLYDRHVAEPFNPGFQAASAGPASHNTDLALGSTTSSKLDPAQKGRSTNSTNDDDLYDQTPVRNGESAKRS